MGLFDMKLFSWMGLKRTPKAPWKKYYKKEDMKLIFQIYPFMIFL